MRTFTTSRTPNGRLLETAEGFTRSELFVPLMKFDERSGEFTAWSTVQEIDGHNDRCDVEKSWPALVKWAGEQEELSKGKSIGNLRRQHRRDTSVGKITLMEKRDMDGVAAVYIEGRVTDDSAKSDAATGVLTGISIRGLSVKVDDPENPGGKLYAWAEVEEKSLVDRPAVPHALIEVLKSDGGVEMVKALGRQPKQYWNCGIEGCNLQHEKKEEAIKCETIPTRLEATEKSADADDTTKSLYQIANLISIISSLLGAVSDAEYEETWRAISAGETTGTPIAQQLREVAQKTFDALEAMIADERADVDEALTQDVAMSYAMRAVAESETAKQLIRSLRVPSGNGSQATTETVKQEDTMNEEMKKALDEQKTAHEAKVEELQKSLNKTSEDLTAASATITAQASKIDEMEKQLGTLGETLTESMKAQAKTLAFVTGVKVSDDTDLKSVLDAIKNRPASPAAAQRLVPVSKSADTDTSVEEPARELTPEEKLSPKNRTRIA